MKIALFKMSNISVPIQTDDEGFCWADDAHDYARVSDSIEVAFPMLDEQTILDNQISVIDKKIQRARADFNVQLESLENEKQKLLALPAGK